MARLGNLRVSDVLDYERDIKGKGLIRLRAGVGTGKNYWVRHLPEQYPKLQILMITSRKNVAAAEGIKLGTDNRIHTSQLINTADREWYEDMPGSLMVCTNAYLEYFLKNIYDIQNRQTHLWDKFDVRGEIFGFLIGNPKIPPQYVKVFPFLIKWSFYGGNYLLQKAIFTPYATTMV